MAAEEDFVMEEPGMDGGEAHIDDGFGHEDYGAAEELDHW